MRRKVRSPGIVRDAFIESLHRPQRGASGESNGNARLSNEAVRAMRRDHQISDMSMRQLGEKYQCNPATASRIVNYRIRVDV